MFCTFNAVAFHVPAVLHGADDVQGAVHVALLSSKIKGQEAARAAGSKNVRIVNLPQKAKETAHELVQGVRPAQAIVRCAFNPQSNKSRRHMELLIRQSVYPGSSHSEN